MQVFIYIGIKLLACAWGGMCAFNNRIRVHNRTAGQVLLFKWVDITPLNSNVTRSNISSK